MNSRITISIILVSLGLIAFILPEKNDLSIRIKPEEYLKYFSSEQLNFSPDEVAYFVVAEDSTVQLIDLRSPEIYMKSSIPGALNVPFNELNLKENYKMLNQKEYKIIVYSEDDLIASQAQSLLVMSGLKNIYVMKGGLNAWNDKVMLSEYTGETITPQENRLFEIRYKARRFFNEINSLPDSLKIQYLESKKASERELVGGCE